jgi:hypothetical protein
LINNHGGREQHSKQQNEDQHTHELEWYTTVRDARRVSCCAIDLRGNKYESNYIDVGKCSCTVNNANY